MSPAAVAAKMKPAQTLFLVLGYVCVLGCAVNIINHLGWVDVRIPGLHGFSALWKLALGATICLVIAWYIGRPTRDRSI